MDNLKEEMSERIRLFRESLGFSQKEFSIELDISQQTLSKYERGAAWIPDEIKIKLRKMGISFLWLLDGEGSMYRDGFSEKSTSTEIRQKSNNSIEQLETAENPEAMGMVMSQLNLIQSMLEEKGQLPKEESGHCPVCASYWKLNEKNQAKVIGYTECLLEEQFKSVDIEEDDSNAAENAG